MDEEVLREKRARLMDLGDPAGTGSSAGNMKCSANSAAGYGVLNPSNDAGELAGGKSSSQAPPLNNYM